MSNYPYFKTSNGVTEKYLKSNYNDYYNLIFEYVIEKDISLSERIYLYQNKLLERPRCFYCNENKVKFIKFYKGYYKYCSRKCSALGTNKDENIKRKRVDHLMNLNLDPIKRKEMTEKSNRTKSLFSKEEIEISNIKRKKTNLEKWGVENISQNEFILEKIKKNVSLSIEKVNLNKSVLNIKESGFSINGITKNEYDLFCDNCKNNFIIKRYLFNQRKRFNKTICMKCNPIGKSDFENQIFRFVKENYEGEVINGYKFYKKYEIDIFIPELNLGIECNGLWWHSEIYRDKNYHIDKLNFFKEKNIKIINIWEDDWNFKSEIIKSRLLYKFGKVNKIFARKCEIKNVSKKSTIEFLNNNHIQGYCISKYNIGLYHENDLVFICSFGQLRVNLGFKSKEKNYELLRSCSKINNSVIGGFSKILNFFIKNYLPERIISYCDISFNSGNSYELNGFNLIKKTNPNYSWFNKDIGLRMNRWNYRKDKLVKLGYDNSKTEVEIMSSIGYYRIWDCGCLLFECTIK